MAGTACVGSVLSGNGKYYGIQGKDSAPCSQIAGLQIDRDIRALVVYVQLWMRRTYPTVNTPNLIV